MPCATFKLIGAARTREALRGGGKRAVRAALQELLRGVIAIQGNARRRAPVAFGDLRSSLFHTPPRPAGPGLFSATAGTKKSYAPFVEFGTGPAGAQTAAKLTATAQAAMRELGYKHGAKGGWPPDDVMLTWMARKGISEEFLFPIQRSIRAEGTAAQPFLFPAFEEETPRAVARMRTAVNKAFQP